MRQVIHELPTKNYATYAAALSKAKALLRVLAVEIPFVIGALPRQLPGDTVAVIRYFPILLPTTDQVHLAFALAHQGYPVVRT